MSKDKPTHKVNDVHMGVHLFDAGPARQTMYQVREQRKRKFPRWNIAKYDNIRGTEVVVKKNIPEDRIWFWMDRFVAHGCNCVYVFTPVGKTNKNF